MRRQGELSKVLVCQIKGGRRGARRVAWTRPWLCLLTVAPFHAECDATDALVTMSDSIKDPSHQHTVTKLSDRIHNQRNSSKARAMENLKLAVERMHLRSSALFGLRLIQIVTRREARHLVFIQEKRMETQTGCLGSGRSVGRVLLVVILHLGVEILNSLLGASLALGTTSAAAATTGGTSSSSTTAALSLGTVGSSALSTLGALGSTGWRSANLGRVDHHFDLEGLLCLVDEADESSARRIKEVGMSKRSFHCSSEREGRILTSVDQSVVVLSVSTSGIFGSLEFDGADAGGLTVGAVAHSHLAERANSSGEKFL